MLPIWRPVLWPDSSFRHCPENQEYVNTDLGNLIKALGSMSSGTTYNLLQHEVPLIVHNRTPAKEGSLLDRGATWDK